jgi:ADP-ribosylglycohydrolase/fructose-1,6-bisphosphatase/inositol monophosphatase family enzyme
VRTPDPDPSRSGPPTGGYARPLAVAVEAARAAARLLVAEFHRPGGPRGSGSQCPADTEAEELVRQALLEAFPEFGFIAEEAPARDQPPRDPDRHTWVVDPNDGTRYFLSGRRGASISIGLLRDGVPVLGVVLAHTAPHGGEDLFGWAEGLGAVTRNGEPVTASHAAAALHPGAVVLVSPSAEEHPLGSALTLAPGRFRPVASIAYRLALVAAGEAEAAVSLQPLDGHDVVAGHALLLGAGLVLLDAAGVEVRYHPAGKSRIGPVAAGGRALATELAGRLSRRHEPPITAAATELVATRAGQACADPALLRRAQGALLGQLCGDALGSLVEFESEEEIAEDYPDGVRELVDGGTWNLLAGQPTDDSELALALARSLIRRGGFEAADAVRAYVGWYESRPFDIGHTTRAALGAAADALRAGQDPVAAARASARRESRANGSLMRVSPLGIFGHRLETAALAALAREDGALTHPHPDCADAGVVFTAAVARAVAQGGTPAGLADWALGFAREQRLQPAVIEALVASATHRPDYATHQGLVTVALQNAFFQLRHAEPEAALVDTVRRGGDTDTNAAIAGALLGAVHGVHGLPLRWRNAVLTCFPVAGMPGCQRPRPPSCWAVDALVVAERLLAGS